MKTTFILHLALPAALLAGAVAQLPAGLTDADAASSAEQVGTLPEGKRNDSKASRLQSEERNPFASRTDEKGSGPTLNDTQSEEARIRAVLEKFTVNGIAKSGDGGFSATMQSIILREGELLTQVIDGQIDQLRVTKVTPQMVEITWVGDEDATNPRQITMAVEMSPKVSVMLPTPGGVGKGQLTVKNTSALPGADDLEQ